MTVPLDPVETVSGMVFGARDTPLPEVAEPDPSLTPREVFESLLVPALARRPCLVAFSGGRDSSTVLAAAAHVARANGLQDPIPVTMRFAGHPRTWEDDWQEKTVAHLGLRDWHKLSLTTELDALGPIAQRLLRANGPFWPGNAQSMALLLQTAAGGTLLTGNGGDEVFNRWGWRRIAEVRRLTVRPNRWDLKHTAVTFLPAAASSRLWRRRSPLVLPWLRAPANEELGRRWAESMVMRERTWAQTMESFLAGRYVELATSIFTAAAAQAGTQLVQPFMNPTFVRSMTRHEGRLGPESRAASLEAHFGDLLPREVLERSTKATFTEVLWGPESRAFAGSWGGTGLDESLVDVDGLRAQWARPTPDFRSMSALQAAWLAQEGKANSTKTRTVTRPTDGEVAVS